MKTRFPYLLLVLAGLAQAQTTKPAVPTLPAVPPPAATPVRKTLTFQPGAKTPDEAVSAPSVAAAVGVNAPPPGADPSFDLAAAFFGGLEKNQIEEAYTTLTKGSKIGDRPEELRTLKAKTSEALSLFGEIRGFELVETKLVGSALRRYTFLSFGRDFPLRWRFYFYRTEKAWRLIDLHVDDRLAGIFEEQEPVAAETKP